MSYCKSVFPTAYDEYILRNRITQCHGLGQAKYVTVRPRPTDKCYWPEDVALTKAMEQANLSGIIPESWKNAWYKAMATGGWFGPIGTTAAFALQWVTGAIKDPTVTSPDDILAKALKDYQEGKITYEQYMAILKAVADLKRSAPSGLSQMSSMLKWFALILGIVFAGYLVVKFGGLIPTKRR